MSGQEGPARADRGIFRGSAIAAYQRSRNRDTLPRLTSWPTIAFFWVLLAGLLAAMVLAWSVRVPTYVAGSGVILPAGARLGAAKEGAAGSGTTAALFLTPDQSARVRVGQSVHGQVGSSGLHVAGTVRSIRPGVVGPDAVRRRYRLGSSEVVAQPARVVIVGIRRTLPPAAYAGSGWTAQVEVGAQRLLSFLPGLG